MSYTNFNRHESMNSETRKEIMNLINDLINYDEQIDKKLRRSIENKLYGLFDGYLYEKLQLNALECPSDLASRIMKIYHKCAMYPKSETIVF
jgi:hypothetical protein